MRKILLCLLASACCLNTTAQSAATARLGALGRNDLVITNVTFGGSSSHITDGTNTITATRDVYETAQTSTDWVFEHVSTGSEGGTLQPPYSDKIYIYWCDEDDPGAYGGAGWYVGSNYGPATEPYSTDPDLDRIATYIYLPTEWEADDWQDFAFVATRRVAGKSYPVGRLALTNDIPQGGGAPAWEVVSQGFISYTNGMMDVSIALGNLSCVTNGWPDGASMFLRLHPTGESYVVLDPLRLVGYGAWPTNDAQAVAWRSGTNVFVNILVEERQ